MTCMGERSHATQASTLGMQACPLLSDGTMLNPIFWKKVHGQKHPERWEIEERKIPSVKMLFETNSNGHKHPSISLIGIEQDTIGETKGNNKWHSTQEPRSPKKKTVL